ncbi:unnamed protein product, partial [Rotaria magnacalcarata]
KQADLLAFQEISNVNIYLSCCYVLGILKLDSAALIPYKESLCLKLDDNSYTVLPDIKTSFSYLTDLLIKKKDEMTRTSIEMNTHTMAYITLLITNNQLLPETLRIWLFSSQACESMFRTARSMSGTFSSVVNFSVTEFLRRAEKLSVLQTIKSEVESNPDFPFHFPSHHKQEIERIVQHEFADARELVASLNITILNKVGNPIAMDEVSVIVENHLVKQQKSVVQVK